MKISSEMKRLVLIEVTNTTFKIIHRGTLKKLIKERQRLTETHETKKTKQPKQAMWYIATEAIAKSDAETYKRLKIRYNPKN